MQLITVLPSLKLLFHHPHVPRGWPLFVSFIPLDLSQVTRGESLTHDRSEFFLQKFRNGTKRFQF